MESGKKEAPSGGAARDAIDILVVEDSPTQAARLTFLLRNHGHRVIAAGNGREALEAIDRAPPDMIVTDVLMPEMDGYQLCRAVKDSPAHRGIPVLLLTSLTEPEEVLKGLLAGADNFVTKPFAEEFLLSRIETMRENRRLRGAGTGDGVVEVVFRGRRHLIEAERVQAVDLLLSVYENAVEKNRELERANRELREALATIKSLRGLIPICAWCKKIRDDDGYWQMVEEYITEHSDAAFTHGMCPECERKMFEAKGS